MRIALLLAVTAMCASAAPAVAQVPQPRPVQGGQLPAGPGRISGLVSDTAGNPLPTAAITIRSAVDSAIVTGVLTNASGQFMIDGLMQGRYLLRVSLVGYKSRNSEVIELTMSAPMKDLGEIPLDVVPLALDALTAEAERAPVVVEADRTTYNAKAMPVAETGTATDVLRAVPELEVDVNDNVKLRGNQAVAIHLNGRPAPLRGEQLANFLNQLPGNRIERVEVMPNPSAKHDPEGMGGIVNIVLRDDLDLGLSGSVNVATSTKNRQRVGGRLNYQRGRLTLFSGAGANLSYNSNSNYDHRENLITDPVTIIEQNGSGDSRSIGWNLDWTAELKVGERATLWSNAWMFSSNHESDGTIAYRIHEADIMRDYYDRENAGEFDWGNYNFGAGYRNIIEPQKEELTIDGRYSRGRNDSENRFRNLVHVLDGDPATMPNQLTFNDIDAGNGNVSVQADYYRPLAGGRIDIGYRAWQRTQDNDNDLRIYAAPDDADPSSSTRTGFEFDETFHSLYTTYGRTFGKLSVQGGLRLELASAEFASLATGQSHENNYNSLFPSVNVSWAVQPGRTFRAQYSKRISRPSPFYLDPVMPITDPLNIQAGNPELKPSYTQSFSVDFAWTGSRGMLRVGPYLRSSTDIWERIRTVDTLGVATNRWENAASSRAYGSNFTISLSPTGRLSGSTSFSLYRDERDGTNISSAYRREAWMWSLGGNMGFKFTSSLAAQVFANYFPTESILQGRASGYTFTSLSLRQQIWGTKGSITLSVQDPLNLYKYNSYTRDATYIQTSRSSFAMRTIMLGLTYNFGKPPQQQSRRSGDVEDTGETIRVR